jgi:cytochrome c553
MNRHQVFLLFALGLHAAQAQMPDILQGADLKLGEKLIAENQCVACHQQKFIGDGSAIYRPSGRINTTLLLRSMVERCNTDLGLNLFPEEVTAIGAVLNRDHYQFK